MTVPPIEKCAKHGDYGCSRCRVERDRADEANALIRLLAAAIDTAQVDAAAIGQVLDKLRTVRDPQLCAADRGDVPEIDDADAAAARIAADLRTLHRIVTIRQAGEPR